MIRRIIKIDENKCNGCELCVNACHEGAIAMVGGRAKLMRDDYCDGLGDCLPVCPTGAISFEEREADEYDREAVEENMRRNKKEIAHTGCPGNKMIQMDREAQVKESRGRAESMLSQWPVQIKLIPVNAPYFDGARLLVAADCTAFAYAEFHNDFIKNHITLIGCPKLDEGDYSEKLTEIIKSNDIKSIKVARMEVPCCSGIENAVRKAIVNSGKMIPWQVVVVGIDGNIKE